MRDITYFGDPSEFKLLEKTSAECGVKPWAARPALTKGEIYAVATPKGRVLSFMASSGQGFNIGDDQIKNVTKAAGGINIVADVLWLRDGDEHPGVICFVGPRGRMKTIFASLGHPL